MTWLIVGVVLLVGSFVVGSLVGFGMREDDQ